MLNLLPSCLRELTGCKYVCPRYWILERAKKVKLWNKIGWLLCVKEVKARIDNTLKSKMESKRKEWKDIHILIFILCLLYLLERSEPFLTASWKKWKRALIFNRISDKIVDFLLARLP